MEKVRKSVATRGLKEEETKGKQNFAVLKANYYAIEEFLTLRV